MTKIIPFPNLTNKPKCSRIGWGLNKESGLPEVFLEFSNGARTIWPAEYALHMAHGIERRRFID